MYNSYHLLTNKPFNVMCVCALNALFMCLSSARNEDKSGGWIREKNRQKKYLGFTIKLGFKAKGNFSSF